MALGSWRVDPVENYELQAEHQRKTFTGRNAKPPFPPIKDTDKVGDLTTTRVANRNGKIAYWRFNGQTWSKITKTQFKSAQLEAKRTRQNYDTLTAGDVPADILRYPEDVALGETDYVLFEFYEYKPPFQGLNKDGENNTMGGLAQYNQSATDAAFYEKTSGVPSVVLYMPEDISTGYKANWSGKSFSNVGRDVLGVAGADLKNAAANIGRVADTGINQLLPNAATTAIQEVISKITGEQIDRNDITGSTRGVILNPNVELLFGGIDLRNFQLNFKLVPRKQSEAVMNKQIVNSFRKAMLPNFALGNELNFSSSDATSRNYIKVPNVCKVSFMRGGSLNTDVAQYKMCAITQVDVNYTPDGTYATYEGGEMVAVGLTLNFQETKLIFADEVEQY
mgnify:CR=1 FL=1|tara:strand:- start:1260 stop:2441 length:1182 start_codon:yes stop_codon:yes gene_type:complete